MVRTSLKTPKYLLEEFQRVLRLRYGKVKGVQEACLSDALKLWMGFLGGSDRYLYGVLSSGGFEEGRVLSVEELGQALDRCDYAYLRPANEHGVLSPAMIEAVVEYARDRGFKAYSTRGFKALKIKVNYEDVARSLTDGFSVYFLPSETEDPISAALAAERAISLTERSLHLTSRTYFKRLIEEERHQGSSSKPSGGQGNL